MRDITPDLEERLTDIKGRKEVLQQKLADLDRREMALLELLAEERERNDGLQSLLFNGNPKSLGTVESEEKLSEWTPQTPISSYLLKALGDKQPHSLDELVLGAKIQPDIDFGEKNPGRSLHFALVGLAENHLVRRIADESDDKGKWQLVAP